MQPKVSIVVPMYNTAPYMEKCLNSLLSQTLEEIEILCVDDASPDNSSQIVKDYQTVDNRVQLLTHDINLGQGGARNTGIANARSNYIANVDCDDWVDTTMMEALYVATEGETVDIVACGFDRVSENGDLISEHGYEEELIDSSDTRENIFELLNPAIWNKLFKKSLCTDNNIKFPNYLSFEDLATTPRLVAESNKVRKIKARPYKYRIRDNSVMASYTLKHVLDCIQAFSVLQNYLVKRNLLDRYQVEFRDTVNKHLRFRVNGLMRSGMSEELIEMHLKQIAYLKWSFLENGKTIDAMDTVGLKKSIITDYSLLDYDENDTVSRRQDVA